MAALTDARVEATFAALRDPIRRAIVARLARGDATVNELAAPFDISVPAVCKHLKILENCGLISRSRRGLFRPCHLEGAALDGAVGWMMEQRQVWFERFKARDADRRGVAARPHRPALRNPT